MGNRILRVDTEGDPLGALACAIEASGLHVEIVADGGKALEWLQLVSLDVVVLEVRAPETGGMETLGWIKQSHPGTEVIILTGCESAHGTGRDARRGL